MEFREINIGIRNWVRGTASQIDQEGRKLGIKHSDDSTWARIRTATRTSKMGIINKISFKAPKHAALLIYGVGKGREKGSGKEKPKNWAAPISQNMNDLADYVADKTGDIIISKVLKP